MSNGMILCERHLIKPHHPFYCECDRLTFLAKNLYNATLYYQRDSFFNKDFKSYYDVNKVFTHTTIKKIIEHCQLRYQNVCNSWWTNHSSLTLH